MQIETLDWIVIAVYLIFVAAVGIIVGLKVKDTDHYFLGKRRFGPWLMIGQSFGIGTHAEMPVSLAGAVYSMGFSGIWMQWKNLFVTPFYWIMAPIFRRIRRTTMSEVTEDRYGSWMAGVYTIFAIIFFTINTANMLKGAGKVISQASGGQVGVNEIVIAMTVIFILYSFIGGLVASAWTDCFQSFLIIILSFMLIPLGWAAVGGMDGMRQSLEGYKFSLATPEGIGIWFIATLTINGLVGIMAQPHMLATVGTGKDERTCRIGILFGHFVKRFCTVGWAFVGLIAATMMAQGTFGVNALEDPENAFGFVCRQLLFPGALGLLIASVLATNMSTCSAFLVDSGALFTQGFYRRHLVLGRPDRHYLWVGRLSGFLITMLGVFYAIFLIKRVLYSFLLTETMATFMGISILGGFIWPRANRCGALSSLVAAFGTNFLLYYLMGERLDHFDPKVFLAALLAGIFALVVMSLLTTPESEEKMKSFFGRLQTPTEFTTSEKTEAVLAPAPATLIPAVAPAPAAFTPSGLRTPAGGLVAPILSEAHQLEQKDPWSQGISLEQANKTAAETGQQLLLVNLLHPRRGTFGQRFWKAYRTDFAGFALGWAVTIGLIALTWLLLQL